MKTSLMKQGSPCPNKKKGGFLKRLMSRAKITGLALMASIGFAKVAMATDLMASGKGDVVATFGSGSLVMLCIILAEVVVGVAAYIKTRNPLTLVGLAIVIVFTGIATTYIS